MADQLPWRAAKLYGFFAFSNRPTALQTSDKNTNVLKHVFITFIFTKLQVLCIAYLIMH